MEGKVKFFAFAAGEFLDEEMFYVAEALAKAEDKTHEEVEKELIEKLSYPEVKGKQHPFECWGPQELADRINKAKRRAG